jgi:hypothetical protein
MMADNAHLKWIRWKGNECPVGPKAYVYVIYAGSKVPVGPLPAAALIWSQCAPDRKIGKYAEVHEIVHTVRR